MVSHAAYPTPLRLSADRLRIYFNTRDTQKRGLLAWIDVDPADPFRILDIAEEPALAPGPVGTFDDRGISNGSIQRIGDEIRLYYLGWNQAVDVPFRNSIGLAVSRDGARFERRFEGPLLDRSRFDPFTLTYPFVQPADDAGPWRMYYGSSREAGNIDENFRHVMTEATSSDGIDWRPRGTEIVSLGKGERAITRPWRMDTESAQLLLYSIRRDQYRIGASVRDGEEWRRISDDLLGPSDDDWDSDASCYPAIIDFAGGCGLLYCGNGYGRTGFGLALIEEKPGV